jgi:hypothetical protein
MPYETFAHCSRCGCKMARFSANEKPGAVECCAECGKLLMEQERSRVVSEEEELEKLAVGCERDQLYIK